jgi:hypothetical protein
MPNFGRIISLAYLRILERLPDPGGLDNFNRLMNQGLSESLMREALLRSAEYAAKNPDVLRSESRSAAKSRKNALPRKKTREHARPEVQRPRRRA